MNDYYKTGFNVIKWFLLIVFAISIPLLIILYNKDKCESKGGTYIFEIGNNGSSCHYITEGNR